MYMFGLFFSICTYRYIFNHTTIHWLLLFFIGAQKSATNTKRRGRRGPLPQQYILTGCQNNGLRRVFQLIIAN